MERRHRGRRAPLLRLALAAALLAASLPAAPPAAAATITVTSLADAAGSCPSPSSCTLRAALATAQQGDTITFGMTGTILVSSVLFISTNVTIQGPGPTSLAIDGQRGTRVFLVNSGVTATIAGLTIQNGNAAGVGGGILNQGTLTVANTTLSGNVATSGGGISNDLGTLTVTNSTLSGNAAGVGGGILNRGTLTVANTTLSGNVAGSGGGIDHVEGGLTVTNSTLSGNVATSGGGIYNRGTLTVTNSTLSGNVADQRGGGIYHIGGGLTVTNSTLSGNAASSSGGGIFDNVGTLSLRNSIVVNSPSGGNCAGGITSNGNNLSDTTACFAGGSQGDIVSANPGLGPLALNAPGATMTHALLDGSPAIDGVTDNPSDCGTTVAADQRGVTRPQAVFGARCDIGAFERLGTAPQISPIGPQTTAEDTPTGAIPFTVGDDQTPPASLAVSASSANQALVPNGNITLGGSGASRTITLSPAANQVGTAEITVSVSDGAFTSSTTFTLTVTAVNDAPVISGPGPQTTPEDTPLVFSAATANPISIADPDAGATPIRVVLTATGGILSVSLVPGVSIVSGANDSAVMTLNGTVPNLNLALNGLRFSPTPGTSGPASLEVFTNDLGNTGAGGPKIDQDTVAITVTPVDDPPSAADDRFTVAAGQTLEVAAGQGVLANDTDVDSPASALSAAVASSPGHGTLALAANGGFTYRPADGFAGTDRFTYRASDGHGQSSPATVTIAVTPTSCLPRPRVQTAPAVGGGKLAVHVEATPLNTQQNNPLREVRFGAFQNATVSLNGQAISSGQTYTPPPNTYAVDFTVERAMVGQPTTVHFTVVDGCGEWKSFVGGGTAAGF